MQFLQVWNSSVSEYVKLKIWPVNRLLDDDDRYRVYTTNEMRDGISWSVRLVNSNIGAVWDIFCKWLWSVGYHVVAAQENYQYEHVLPLIR